MHFFRRCVIHLSPDGLAALSRFLDLIDAPCLLIVLTETKRLRNFETGA